MCVLNSCFFVCTHALVIIIVPKIIPILVFVWNLFLFFFFYLNIVNQFNFYIFLFSLNCCSRSDKNLKSGQKKCSSKFIYICICECVCLCAICFFLFFFSLFFFCLNYDFCSDFSRFCFLFFLSFVLKLLQKKDVQL